MNLSSEPVDPRLEKKLELMMDAPTRNPQAASRRRANFLVEAEMLAQPITGSWNQRHNRWIDPIITFLVRKERSPMFAPLVSILVVVSLLAGGGATVFAAQDSLPGQALYEVKLASEELRLNLTNSSQGKVSLYLAFASRRINELETLFVSGAVPPGALLARLQTQLDQSMALAAGLEDAPFERVLDRARQELKNQVQTLQHTGIDSQAPQQAVLALTQTREMVQERLNWVETGLSDPQAFRLRWRHRNDADPVQVTDQPGGTGPGPLSSQTPGRGAGPGPLATCTCTPGSGVGPGPFVTGTPTPGSGYGPGPGPQATQPGINAGSGQQVTHTPGGNGGIGPGPGPKPGSTCTPQSESGPGPAQGSGGNGDGGGGGNGSGGTGGKGKP